MTPTTIETERRGADSLHRMVRRREALLKQLEEVRAKIKAIKAQSGDARPKDGQRIRIYRHWRGNDKDWNTGEPGQGVDEHGQYLEGVFYEKGSKRPYHTECKYVGGRMEGAHILCDDGGVAGFKIVKNRKDRHGGWRAV